VLHAAELLVTNNGLTSFPDSICSLPLLRTLIVEGAASKCTRMCLHVNADPCADNDCILLLRQPRLVHLMQQQMIRSVTCAA
jgi:hypothetical protein